MLRLTPIFLAAALAGCSSRPAPEVKSHPHGGHEAGHTAATLMVQADPARPAAGQPTTLKLMIHGAGGTAVKDFAVVHEQKAHLIVIRDGLDQFAHLHPEIDAQGNMTARYSFPTGGNYLLFVDYQPSGGEQATAAAQLSVSGTEPPAPELKPDVPAVVTGDGLNAKVSVAGAKSGGEATVTFDLTTPAGQPATDLQPYMGAMGHLVVLSRDGRQYVHAHPVEGKPATGNVVAFMAHFPEAGLYKGWGQFRRGDKVCVVPFVAKVD
ncbi:MAG: hypothetical protein U0746_10355 [Gemmataceae bacterium]